MSRPRRGTRGRGHARVTRGGAVVRYGARVAPRLSGGHSSSFAAREVRGASRSPFFGDYNYVSATTGARYAVWTDTRDLVPGTDPRGTAKPGGVDTFDGAQTCTWVPNDINAPTFSSPSIGDPCLAAGGLDQNIYVARLP